MEIDIVQPIKDILGNAEVYLRNPDGGGHHLEAVIISSSFEGLSPVQRQRIVMKGVDFDTAVHALTMKTFTPSEWEEVQDHYEHFVEGSVVEDPLKQVKVHIAKEIADHEVVLYMKGTKDAPRCGFSMQVVQILKSLGVEFLDKNVLADEHLRQAIKEFSDWPTIPQLYIKGEFIGGCDIITDMFESGELEKKLGL